jgi:hypothetical protein
MGGRRRRFEARVRSAEWNYRHLCIAGIPIFPPYCVGYRTEASFETGVQIDRIHERIRELCDQTVNATEPELDSLVSELRAALREHAEYVSYMALRASSRSHKNLPGF